MTAAIDANDNERPKFSQSQRHLCINRWAWGLLIVGLFILCISLLGTILAWDTYKSADQLQPEHPIFNETQADEGDLDISITIKRSYMLNEVTIDKSNCNMVACALYCQKSINLYSDILDSINGSTCSVLQKAIFANQDFDIIDSDNAQFNTALKVGEVVLISSIISTPKAQTFFKAHFFHAAYLFSVHHGQFEAAPDFLVELPNLRYLTIATTMQHLAPNFFKPVCKTLTNLVINANLSISTKQPFFGTEIMSNLTLLDLSRNNFLGALSNIVFSGLRNLKYLRLQECKILSIESNFLQAFSANLVFLDLSHNLLTNLAGDFFTPLSAHSNMLIDLNFNNWYCNCEFQAFLNTYNTYKANFVDGAYCTRPKTLQGILWQELDHVRKICKRDADKNSLRATTNVLRDVQNVIKPKNESEKSSPEPAIQPTSTTAKAQLPSKTLDFPPADYNFYLTLLKDNSVRVDIENCPDDVNINIVWFAELTETMFYNSLPVDYNCDRFRPPNIQTLALEEDTTYTFCIVPDGKTTITPYNCLPMYVPQSNDTNVMDMWIPEEYKSLTIWMLTASLGFSLLCGALIAYFCLRNYPNLLEGSKNVLVVKEDGRKCISTICDMEKSKRSSIYKPCVETVPERHHSM